MNKSLIFPDLLHLAQQPDQLPWQPFRDGIDIVRLYTAAEGQGSSAALLRYQPGATVPRHHHAGYEHVWVLSGSQIDHNGTHTAGTFVVNPPQSSHSVTSPDGCIVLVIWEKPVELWS